jgi:hypothetical protein
MILGWAWIIERTLCEKVVWPIDVLRSDSGAVTFDSHFAPHSQLRKLVFCNSGLDSRLPFGGFHEVHAHEVHACEVRIYEVHTHEMQACEVHAHEVHA